MIKWIKPLGSFCFLVLICMNPDSALTAASDSLSTWALSVAPALLPFLIAAPALTCREVAELLSRVSGGFLRLFRLPAHSTGALLIGFLSGSPSGAAALAAMNRHSSDSPGALLRASLMASGASPAFLLSGIAAGMLARPDLGRILLCSQLGAVLLCGLLLRPFGQEKPCILRKTEPLRQSAVLSAMLTLLTVGGYMTLFSVLARALSDLLSPTLETPLLALTELAGGTRALCALPVSLEAKLPLVSAAACFGGLSVYAQCMSFLKPIGIDPLEYAAGKLLQSAVAAVLTFLQLRMPHFSVDASTTCLTALCILLCTLSLCLAVRRRRKKRAASDVSSEAAA